MQRSYKLVARLVRMLVDLKAGARTGLRSAGAHAQGAASGTATVGRGIKGASAQGGALKDFASGGRNWWSHMPKTPQLPGALADAAHSGGDQQSDCGDRSSWAGGLSESEDLSYLDNELSEVDLMALRTAGPDTPADVLLGILSDMLDGREPDLRDVALARAALLRHLNLYEPFNGGGHIRSADLDADVMDSLMHQLGAAAAASASATTADPGAASGPPSGSSSSSSSDLGTRRTHDAREGAAAAAAADAASRRASTDREERYGDLDEGRLDSDCLRDALAALLAAAAAEPLPPPLLLLRGPAEAEASAAGSSSGSGSGSESDVSSSTSGGAAAAVPLPMLDEVERMLAMADAWQYDTFRLAEVSQGHALSCLGFFLLHREGLIAQFRIRPTKLARLLRTLECGYPANPYHNSTHAADVLQTLHVLLRGSGLAAGGHYLDRLGLMATYFAAMIHDHGHPGLTSDFLIGTSHGLALRYNDRSPLENHHGASFFELLGQPGLDALEGLGGAERTAFRKLVLDLVLATDMKQHFSLLAHFNTAHRLVPYNKDAGPWALLHGTTATAATAAAAAAATAAATVAARSGGGGGGGGGGSRQQQHHPSRCGPEPFGGDEAAAAAAVAAAAGRLEGSEAAAAAGGAAVAAAAAAAALAAPVASPCEQPQPRPLDETERVLSLQIALKAADLGHLGEELAVHKRWVRSLEEEFFRQGDREAALGLPISPLFDRSKQGASKSQVGFYDFIALPLVASLASAFPGALPLLAAFVDNYDHWRGVEKKAAAAAAAAATAAAATAAATAAAAAAAAAAQQQRRHVQVAELAAASAT